MNGNGRIDKGRFNGYLASINQLSDLWIGENSPLTRNPDYTNSARGKKIKQWYASSTVLDKDRQGLGTNLFPLYFTGTFPRY